MTYIVIVLAVLAIWTWFKYETVSPKLIVREGASVAGAVVGATPVVTRTAIKAGKAANLASEVALREAGEEGPLGFREGRAAAYSATKTTLADTNKALDESISADEKRLRELKETLEEAEELLNK